MEVDELSSLDCPDSEVSAAVIVVVDAGGGGGGGCFVGGVDGCLAVVVVTGISSCTSFSFKKYLILVPFAHLELF